MSYAWYTLEGDMSEIPDPTICPFSRWVLSPWLTFVVHIEFIGVRGILSSIGVPGTSDLQPELQRIYLCSFFLSYTSEEAARLVWFNNGLTGRLTK